MFSWSPSTSAQKTASFGLLQQPLVGLEKNGTSAAPHQAVPRLATAPCFAACRLNRVLPHAAAAPPLVVPWRRSKLRTTIDDFSVVAVLSLFQCGSRPHAHEIPSTLGVLSLGGCRGPLGVPHGPLRLPRNRSGVLCAVRIRRGEGMMINITSPRLPTGR
ncbi:unnamed protein product [Ectocarpus sp. 12 AP-2014]